LIYAFGHGHGRDDSAPMTGKVVADLVAGERRRSTSPVRSGSVLVLITTPQLPAGRLFDLSDRRCEKPSISASSKYAPALKHDRDRYDFLPFRSPVPS